jgi:hypothetical protein
VGLYGPEAVELLRQHGYVEEEYFVSGIVEGEAYVTSALVRKPKDSAAFSGLVVLEPVHVQGPVSLWVFSQQAIVEGGHAWVAVGSQRGAVEHPIKTSNPIRYETLHIPERPGDDLEAAIADRHSGEPERSASGLSSLWRVDQVSNAILTQLGELIKGNLPGGPLVGSTVNHLILGGASQTGVHTLNFIQYAHPGARMPDGKPIFDGYLPMAMPARHRVAGGDAAVIHMFAEG